MKWCQIHALNSLRLFGTARTPLPLGKPTKLEHGKTWGKFPTGGGSENLSVFLKIHAITTWSHSSETLTNNNITSWGWAVPSFEPFSETIFGGFQPFILISELWIYSRSLANQILTNFAFRNVKIRPMVQKLASKEDEAYILLKFEMYVYEISLLQVDIKHI